MARTMMEGQTPSCNIYQERFGVSMQLTTSDGDKLGNIQRVKLKEAEENTALAEKLIHQFGVLYLISQDFPQIITAPNFELHEGLVKMIDAMYLHYDFPKPILEVDQFDGKIITPDEYRLSEEKATVLYSGGKDSMWVYWKLIEELGKESVMPIHIKGLNRGVSGSEWDAVLRQSGEFEMDNFRYLDLLNSSKVSGKAVTNARDFLMMSLAMPSALSFGASRILTEGGMLDSKSNRSFPFSKFSFSWKLYMESLEKMGVEVKPDWYKGDTDFSSMRDLYEHKPEWMPLVGNCFTPVYRRRGSRTRWKKSMPDWDFYKDQCGSCIKCRSVGLARLLWDSTVESLPKEQALFMINDNEKWVDKNRADYANMGIMREIEHWISEAEKKWIA